MLGWWLPESVSTHGGGVFHWVYWSSGITMLIAQALLARARRATSTPDRPPLEMVWAFVPALIVVWLGLLSHRSLSEIAQVRPQIALEKTEPVAFSADGCGR